MDDAFFHLERHDSVVALLRAHGATLNMHRNQAGTFICQVQKIGVCFGPFLGFFVLHFEEQASYAGNIEEVKRLVENGVSANEADYDGRTGLVLSQLFVI